MIKKVFLLVLAGLMLLSIPLPVLADDAAKYNFASAQGDKEIAVKPGSEGTGAIYFYNIDGNRITHITLEATGVPEGWQVSIEPPLSETKVLVNDMPVTVTENLYVEPSELFADEPQNVPEGMVSINVPGRGYVLAKLASVTVEVPEGIEYGTQGTIVVSAEAVWLGQGGAAAIKQARNFEFTVTVVSGKTGFSETIVENTDEQSAGVAEANTDITGNTGEVDNTKSGLLVNYRWVPVLIVILAAIVVVAVVLSRRRAVR
jgi:hypothetical protein